MGPQLRHALGGASRHPSAAVAVLFAAALAIALIQGHKTFYFDAGEYWKYAGTFTRHGSFSLLNYEETGLRGYALPLTYFFLRELGGVFGVSDSLKVMVFNAAIVALIAGDLGPRLAEIAWPERRWGLPRRLALGALILVFWSGYLSFPLSDFPALAAALLALVAINSSDSPGWMLVGGIAASYALNARPAYLLLMPLLLLLVFWGWHLQTDAERRSLGRRGVCLGVFLVGIVLIAVPQSILRHHAFDSYNPVPGGSDLANRQYTQGLKLQRYETYVGQGGTPLMEYRDPHTAGVIADLDGARVSGPGEYAGLVLSHPLTMGGVFLRHVVNGLDQRYTTPYVEHLEPPSRRLLRFAGFLLGFLALFRVVWGRGRRSFGRARWRYPAVLLAASATTLPSAVETRFMLPVFLLGALVVLAPGWPSPIGSADLGWRRYRTLAFAATTAIAYFAVVAMIVSQATDHLRLS